MAKIKVTITGNSKLWRIVEFQPGNPGFSKNTSFTKWWTGAFEVSESTLDYSVKVEGPTGTGFKIKIEILSNGEWKPFDTKTGVVGSGCTPQNDDFGCISGSKAFVNTQSNQNE